jgi:hypothetical protein
MYSQSHKQWYMQFIMYRINKIHITNPKPADDLRALVHISAASLSCPSSCAKTKDCLYQIYIAFEKLWSIFDLQWRWTGDAAWCCLQAASSVHYTTSCKHSLVLLRMGEINARNMLSWLKLLINYYCWFWLVVYIIVSVMHGHTYIKLMITVWWKHSHKAVSHKVIPEVKWVDINDSWVYTNFSQHHNAKTESKA